MVCNNILEAMGNTPLISLTHMVDNDSARILVKFEGLNVGGSIKTRTAYNMIVEAEKMGKINKDTYTVNDTFVFAVNGVIVEPSNKFFPLVLINLSS